MREIDKRITEIEKLLEDVDPTSEDYVIAVNNLVKLHEVKSKKNFVSGDIIIGAATNIVGLILVMQFEKVGIITSRAFGLVKRI